MDRKRNSNIELLRIIACLLITFNHIFSKGVPKATIVADCDTLNAALCVLFFQGGKYGCNIFLIISAWFLVDTGIHFRAAIRVWIQTVFYTLVLDVGCVLAFHAKLTGKDLLAIALPLTSGIYWYARAYMFLLLAGPLAKWLFDRVKRFQALLLLCGGLLFSVLPTVTLEGSLLRALPHRKLIINALSFPPVWFIYVYLLVYYIKHRCPKLRDGGVRRLGVKAPAIGAVLLYLCMFAGSLALYRGVYGGWLPKYLRINTLRQLNSTLCFASAFLLFVAALNGKPFENRRINRIATYAFGIYLFQCHRLFEKKLWTRLLFFEKAFHSSPPVFALYCVFGVCAICLMGGILEWGYQQAYKPLAKAVPFLHG